MKTFLLFIALSFTCLFFSCKNKKPVYPNKLYASLESITLQNNEMPLKNEPDISVVKKDSYVIIMSQKLKYESTFNNTSKVSFSDFFTKSYAYSPVDPTIIPIDSIISFKIITLKKFNDGFPANSEVTTLFNFLDGSGNEKSAASVEAQQYFNKYTYYIKLLKLNVPGFAAAPGQFKIVITYKDGKVVEGSTKEFTFI